ncbi:MAG: hypothetical protein II359_00505 [Clostridia bacterium]|nr:hypothetical protein [Clostridia bacterium]
MNKKSIIFIVIAIILVVVGFSSKNTSQQTDVISKAVYVEDGKVLPENEGKIVIVPGKLEAVTPLVDEITGVELPGVIAKRTVERYEKVQNSDEEDGIYYTLEWKNTALGNDNEFNDIVSSVLIAETKLGEFTIDKNALHHVAVGKPFTDFSSQAVHQRGYTIHPTTSVTYISKMDFMPAGNEDFNHTMQYNGRRIYYMDYENMPRISYVTQREESGEYTFIGKQQNGKIMYDKDLGMQAAFDGLQNPDQLAERVESGGMTGAIVAWVIAAFFVLLAVLGMKKKEN